MTPSSSLVSTLRRNLSSDIWSFWYDCARCIQNVCWSLISSVISGSFVAVLFLCSAVEHEPTCPRDDSDSFHQRDFLEKFVELIFRIHGGAEYFFHCFCFTLTFGRRCSNDVWRPLFWIHQPVWAVAPTLITGNSASPASQICRIIVCRYMASYDFGMLVNLPYPIGYKLFVLSSAS